MTTEWGPFYSEVIARLAQFRDLGNGRGEALCPGHDDNVRSLSVAVGEGGKLLVRCHRGGPGNGCTGKEIMAGMGLDRRYLYPDHYDTKKHPKGRPTMDVEETYDYQRVVDDSRVIVHQTLRVRIPPPKNKEFKQRQPNPGYKPRLGKTKENPEWIWNLDGIETVIFGLPELEEAWVDSPDRTVWIVEGERKVLVLRRIGFLATCAPMGAGKWKDHHADYLSGRNVIVWPDEDAATGRNMLSPGIEHVKGVIRSLVGCAKSVRLFRVDSPPWSSYDVVNWADDAAEEIRSKNPNMRQTAVDELLRKRLETLARKSILFTDRKAVADIQPYQFPPSPLNPEAAKEVTPVVTPNQQAVADTPASQPVNQPLEKAVQPAFSSPQEAYFATRVAFLCLDQAVLSGNVSEMKLAYSRLACAAGHARDLFEKSHTKQSEVK